MGYAVTHRAARPCRVARLLPAAARFRGKAIVADTPVGGRGENTRRAACGSRIVPAGGQNRPQVLLLEWEALRQCDGRRVRTARKAAPVAISQNLARPSAVPSVPSRAKMARHPPADPRVCGAAAAA